MFTFYDSQPFGVEDEVRDQIGCLTSFDSLLIEIEAPIDHFDGDPSKGFVHGFSYGIGHVNEYHVQNPGSPELHADPIFRSREKVGKSEESFDNGVGLLDSPPLPVKGDHILGGQTIPIELIGDFAWMQKRGRDVSHLVGATNYIDFKALGYKGDPILTGGRFKKLPLGAAQVESRKTAENN